MPRFRALILVPTAALAIFAVAASAQQSGLVIVNGGLPPVDVGLLMDLRRAPDSPESQASRELRTAIRNDGSFMAGRVIVRFRPEASEQARASAVHQESPTGIIVPRPSHADFDLVRIASGENAESVAAALREHHRAVVSNAQAAYLWQTMFKPNDPLYEREQWNLPYLNLETAWDIQPAAASDIVVAVIDSGVAYHDAMITATIPAFRIGTLIYPSLGRVTMPYAAADQLVNVGTPNRIVAPHDFIWDSADPLDFDGHGTHVSGTIGQITNDNRGTAGVAFNVKLMPVKVLDSIWDILFGAPNLATDDVVARGIRYAADNGAKIINMSIGRAGPPSFVVESAITYAVAKGAFIAVAAGNSFEQGNPVQVLAEIASRVKGAVSVAAIDRNKDHAYYSTAGNYVELAAPGGSSRGFAGITGFVVQQTFVPSSTDTFLQPPVRYGPPRFDIFAYVGYSGTSMATPHVAGAAAMLMQQGITSPAAIEDALERTAVDLGASGRDNFFGYGLINVRNAMYGIGVAK